MRGIAGVLQPAEGLQMQGKIAMNWQELLKKEIMQIKNPHPLNELPRLRGRVPLWGTHTPPLCDLRFGCPKPLKGHR